MWALGIDFSPLQHKAIIAAQIVYWKQCSLATNEIKQSRLRWLTAVLRCTHLLQLADLNSVKIDDLK